MYAWCVDIVLDFLQGKYTDVTTKENECLCESTLQFKTEDSIFNILW